MRRGRLSCLYLPLIGTACAKLLLRNLNLTRIQLTDPDFKEMLMKLTYPKQLCSILLLFILGAIIGCAGKSTVESAKLDQAKATIDLAKDEDADDYAPKSLAFAEETLERAENYIRENPNNTAEVQKLENEAVTYANRALKTTRDAKAVSDKKPEDIALETEMKVTGLRGESRELSEQLKKNQGAIQLENRIAQVREMFKPGEADVLREGSRVIIRLKAIQFPVGGTHIEQSNFPLLAKVSQALRSFEGSEVAVEGHSDSTGSEEKNMTLSQNRAEMVKQYLLSNNTVVGEKIQAVGRGSSAPLASNATKTGRASNRRIDILIDAEKAAE